MKKQLLFFFIIGLIGLSTKGQSVSTAFSNYMTINAAKFNPSAIVDPRFVMDGEFLGVGAQAYNNYGFIPNGFAGLLQGNTDLGRNTNRELANLYNEIEVGLPSFSFAVRNMSFGLITRGRSITKVHRMPAELANYIIEGFRFPEQFNTPYSGNDFYLKSMSWGEVGGMFGMILKQDRDYLINGALTVKRLFGVNTISAYLDEVNYRVDSFDIEINTSTAQYQYVVPEVLHRGWGADIGFTFQKMPHHMAMHTPHSKSGRCDYFEYKYKISAALLDIGRINFNQNASSLTLDNVSGVINDYPNQQVDGFTDLATRLQAEFPDATFSEGTQVRGPLPTSLHLLYDQNFGQGFYAGAQLLYGFQRKRQAGADRLSFFNVTGRYERRFFEAAVPVTLYRYRNPRVGLMLRAYNFYFGTDNLLNFVGDLYGIDAYFGIKFFLQTTKKCREELERIGVKACRTDKKGLFKKKDTRKSRELF